MVGKHAHLYAMVGISGSVGEVVDICALVGIHVESGYRRSEYRRSDKRRSAEHSFPFYKIGLGNTTLSSSTHMGTVGGKEAK